MSFLKKIFRRPEREALRQLCDEIGAEFIQGGYGERDKAVKKVKQWTITLDTLASSGYGAGDARMMAPYVNKDGFRFTIYRKSIVNGIGKPLGTQGIEVGYPDFDRDFIIKGNDESKLRTLFANPRIRQLIQSQPDIYLLVSADTAELVAKNFISSRHLSRLPQGGDVLRFEVPHLITDVERLKSLFELFEETLNQLCQMGSASEDDPNVVL
ncbi:MAG: DUF3137 domain-containing protein [Dehalococcoidia bacterium]